MNKIALFVICIFFVNTGLNAQVISEKTAIDYFSKNNFEQALKEYQNLLKNDPSNDKFKYRIAVCYLNTNLDKTKAIEYLEQVIKNERADANSYYLLGRAYHFANRFDEAINMYETFKKISAGTTYNVKDVEKQIEYCYNAKELVKYPIDVTFQHLGENINSKFSDYYPFVPTDQSYIAFNTRRDDGSSKNPEGKHQSEVYISKEKNGKFTKAKSIGSNVNHFEGDEEIIGMSADGKLMLFLFDNAEEGFGDIFIGHFDGKEVSKLTKMGKEVNSKYTEIAASLSSDGESIYFASDRPGGFGGIDLYVTKKLPNNEWSAPQNLGPTVNTSEDEDFPNLSPDGKTLYFSSKGHTSMGGYDIFKTEWDAEKRQWTTLQNMGYPINTADDNMNLRISETGRYGYISALREGGFGDLDIYQVTFNEIAPRFTVLKGFIKDAEGNYLAGNVNISVTDNQSMEIYGDYIPNPNTGRYIIILPAGNFNILIEADGHANYSEDLEIFDNNSYVPEILKDFNLTK
ncbi:MAG: tetratricopeptide repeat protein [Bacteroidetes bacterium]|nr:hypothetical protein [Bacteroidota bacterium]MBV6460508.1 hypothetical protein [Flavobacteriales bacterium]WKZ74256.1 MAG: tetratricopeptide repeat protein [Vicingaceae bacterium]MCL4815922.1 PD40 domain-containing protein [Flavobacteriales bacterium]NOG94440.1 tetratricopeptide repeat protein [Bacteroidota bacterium]